MGKCFSKGTFFCIPIALVGISLCWASCSPSVARDAPTRTGLVNDYAEIFDPASRKRIESLLTELKQKSGIEFAVLVVAKTGGRSISDYAMSVIRSWGMDAADRSSQGKLLLVLAIKDGEWYTAVSPALGNDLPSDVGIALWDRSRELYEQEKHAEAIERYVNLVIDRLEERRGFSVSRAVPTIATEDTAGNEIHMPHYSLVVSPDHSWHIERLGGPQELVIFERQLADTPLGPVDVQVRFMRNVITDKKLRATTATQNADDIRTIEKNLMVEKGVKTGLYELHDVTMGEEDIAGKRFYFMDYKTQTSSDRQWSSLYLFFPKEQGNEAFVMALYSQRMPIEAVLFEFSKEDLIDLLKTLTIK